MEVKKKKKKNQETDGYETDKRPKTVLLNPTLMLNLRPKHLHILQRRQSTALLIIWLNITSLFMRSSW